MKKYVSFGVLLAFLLVPTIAWAANHYVRAGATGRNNGSDWTNAWTSLPSTLVRGDTYYIADGTYGSYTFNDAVSGATYIYIKKATASNHGTDSGWNSSYGDGQAVFTAANPGVNGVWAIRSSYLELDGQTGGGPGSWQTGFGFKVTCTGTTGAAKLISLTNNYGDDVHHITLTHIEVQHRGKDSGESDDCIYEAKSDIPVWTHNNTHDVTISHCYLHDAARCIFLTARHSDWIVEYCYISDNSSSTETHGAAWADYGSKDTVIRYCLFADLFGTAILDLKENDDDAFDNWEIYGNVFFRRDGTGPLSLGMGVLANTSCSPGDPCAVTNFKFYNNTMYNLDGNNSGVNFDDDGTYENNYVYNNMWVNCVKAGFLRVRDNDYNYFCNTSVAWSSAMGPNSQVGSNLLSGTKSEDFRLIRPTSDGKYLGVVYQQDMNNKTRGNDGNWDMGAFEYDGSPVVPPLPPSGLEILLPAS